MIFKNSNVSHQMTRFEIQKMSAKLDETQAGVALKFLLKHCLLTAFKIQPWAGVSMTFRSLFIPIQSPVLAQACIFNIYLTQAG